MSVKVLSGIVPPAMTTTQRNAIPAGRRPPGSLIYNTTTNRLEMNFGTDATPAWLSANGPVDIQSRIGTNSGYAANFSPGSGNQQLYCDAGSTVPLAITYTPPINVWWEVTANCGIISKVDSAYNYIYLLCNLSVADADGITYVRSISTQHLTVDNYMSLNITKTYKLVGGTTYTAMGMLGSGSGGTWTYYQGGDMLFIESKAYPR